VIPAPVFSKDFSRNLIIMSEKQIRASRQNGARSRGPRTPEGKRRSSRNATRHGLLAQYVVVPGEDAAAFQSLVDSHIAKFGAADDSECDLIEEMAAANWRQRRLWAIEAALFKEATEAQPPGSHLARLAAAFSTLADNGRLALLYRYETRLHLMYRRAYQNLVLMRNTPVPNEPEDPFVSNESSDCLPDDPAVSDAVVTEISSLADIPQTPIAPSPAHPVPPVARPLDFSPRSAASRPGFDTTPGPSEETHDPSMGHRWRDRDIEVPDR
jgi:hypothetical protein